MSKKKKLWRKIKNNPAGASMQDVETLLLRFGFTLERISGSHHIYEYELGEIWKQIIVPLHGKKVKTVYVKQIISLFEELFLEELADDEQDVEENEEDEQDA